jgi:hypothetical protein
MQLIFDVTSPHGSALQVLGGSLQLVLLEIHILPIVHDLLAQ